MNHEPTWLALITSLPTRNATARMRIWRALKAMGCAVLRDGVYLLPNRQGASAALQAQADATIRAGGAAHRVLLEATTPEQSTHFQTLFDRNADYVELKAELNAFHADLSRLDAASAKRTLARLRHNFDAIVAVDFFPGAAQEQAAAALAQAEAAWLALTSPDEPHAQANGIHPLQRANYQGRTWATRRRLWVDRMASAWLIHRFIDHDARFVWLESPRDCPADALGFDFDGAAFTHAGNRVTFEVLAASFDLEREPALARIGALVHYLDVGGIPVAEAAGLEVLLSAMQARCPDDDALLAEACKLFDDLYAAFTPP